jgi:ferrous iron transport protein B
MAASEILQKAQAHRQKLEGKLHDSVVETLYTEAGRICDRAVTREGQKGKWQFDLTLDRLLTSRWLGIPTMILLFSAVFWFTIAGASYPSGLLMELLTGTVYGWLHQGAAAIHSPACTSQWRGSSR